MKTKAFLLSICILSIYSCKKLSESSGCENPFPCTAKYYGKIKLNDSSKYWLPINIDSPITFLNSNGIKISFTIYHHDSGYYQTDLNNRYDNSINCQSLPCSDYGNLGYENIIYQSNDVAYNLIIGRKLNIIERSFSPQIDTVKLFHSGDIMFFSLGSVHTYQIDIKSTQNDITNTTFHNSLMLNGRNYNNIIEANFTKGSIYGNNFVYLSKVYYILGLGIIAYQFSDNELWIKQ